MNVETLLRNRNVEYIDANKDYKVKCLNPAHQDSNPSMRIHKVTGIFNCFSCGFKGNIFIHFGETPSMLDIKISLLQDKISKILMEPVVDLPPDYSLYPEDYRGIPVEVLHKYGAFTTEYIDKLKDRICFPIYSVTGILRGIVGRALYSTTTDKYEVWPSGAKLPVFPAVPMVEKSSIILVEGIVDALNLISKGCDNVVCLFGTTSILKTFDTKLSYLKILGVNKYYIMFDGDNAGKSNAIKLQKNMKDNNYNTEIIELPEGIDPGDLSVSDVSKLRTGLNYENSSN